ncbi:MAG: STY4526/YPO1902 family pathogenicity island replication protein [Saezia sp.]
MSRHSLNEAVIHQVLRYLRDGNLRESLEFGFTEDDIKHLKEHPEKVNALINSPVRWAKVMVDRLLLERLLNRSIDIEKEVAIIDEMLRLDASSK